MEAKSISANTFNDPAKYQPDFYHSYFIASMILILADLNVGLMDATIMMTTPAKNENEN